MELFRVDLLQIMDPGYILAKVVNWDWLGKVFGLTLGSARRKMQD